MAILPVLSKVLKREVLGKMMPFPKDKLPECQFGFRPARSSFAVVFTAHGVCSTATFAGQTTEVAAFDLLPAFDTVDHDILCHGLSQLEIRNKRVKWLRNYLDDRLQQVSTLELSHPPPIFDMAYLKVVFLGRFSSWP